MPLIKIADSNIEFECAVDDTVTRAALRAGLGMPYECNVGCCGTCKFELVDGEVASAWPEAPALSERDRLKKRVLGCQAHPKGDCTIKARIAEQYLPLHLPKQFEARLSVTREITHDIREFHFEAAQPDAFLPGQYALLSLPGVQGQRAYSMSNVASGAGVWQFQIKHMPDGRGTAMLFDRLRIGDPIGIDGPFGSAYLREDSPRDAVCISGGSGISPMLSIARAVMHSPAMAERNLHFFYGGRSLRDICGEAELRELPGFAERLFYYPSLSIIDAGATWGGHVGFVHENVLPTIGGRPADYEYYFAGPPLMTQATQRMLMQNKVPLTQMHFDQFY